jgi:hypothetical protein
MRTALSDTLAALVNNFLLRFLAFGVKKESAEH